MLDNLLNVVLGKTGLNLEESVRNRIGSSDSQLSGDPLVCQ